jgi:hypothetical protein
MVIFLRLCVLLLAASACSCAPAPQQKVDPGDGHEDGYVTAYARGDGQSEIRCIGDTSSAACGSDDIGPLLEFADCSDDAYECVSSYADIMAIPKTGLRPELTYRLRGFEFHVARCFDGSGCEQAMIVASCIDPAACRCRPDWREGRTSVFYYKGEIGVVAFYALPRGRELDENLLKDAIPLLAYNLRSERGFLSSSPLWKLDPYGFKC